MADERISSQSAAMSVGVQSAKGTAATSFITGLLTQSTVPRPEFDTVEDAAEHPAAVSTRTTAKQSLSERTGYLTPVSCEGFMYPRFFPLLLLGVGMKCATNTDNAPDYYTHVFTIEDDDSLAWLTVLHAVSTILDTRVMDVRLDNVTITATPDDIRFSASGNGLSQGDALGTETKTAEQKTKIISTLPASGGWTFEIDNVALTANKVRGFEIVIGQPLEEDDKALWTPTRADMNRDDFGVTGNAERINLDVSLFKKTIYGSAGGTEPDLTPVEIEIMAKWESATNFHTGIPYSIQFDLPKSELSAEVTDATEAETIFFSFNFEMVDDSADPFTVTVINDVASYAA